METCSDALKSARLLPQLSLLRGALIITIDCKSGHSTSTPLRSVLFAFLGQFSRYTYGVASQELSTPHRQGQPIPYGAASQELLRDPHVALSNFE